MTGTPRTDAIQPTTTWFNDYGVLREHAETLERELAGREGWKLVPVEPTKRMTCEAFIRATLVAPDGWSLGTRESQEFFDHIYRIMIATAPEAPAEDSSPR